MNLPTPFHSFVLDHKMQKLQCVRQILRIDSGIILCFYNYRYNACVPIVDAKLIFIYFVYNIVYWISLVSIAISKELIYIFQIALEAEKQSSIDLLNGHM